MTRGGLDRNDFGMSKGRPQCFAAVVARAYDFSCRHNYCADWDLTSGASFPGRHQGLLHEINIVGFHRNRASYLALGEKVSQSSAQTNSKATSRTHYQ
jgi:hypothetical protein